MMLSVSNIPLLQGLIPLQNPLSGMKEPRPELKAGDEERQDSPDFDDLVPPAELVFGD